jgi:hypothetical protein
MRRAVVLLALLTVASDAPAAPMRFVARTSRGGLRGDGARWVAFRRARAEDFTLLDAATGIQRRLPARCFPVAARRAVFLLRCGERAELLFPGRRLQTPVGWRAGDELSAIGRYWLAGVRDAPAQQCVPDESCGPPAMLHVFVNWRTGDRRKCQGSCDFDLDGPRLRPNREYGVVQRGGGRTLIRSRDGLELVTRGGGRVLLDDRPVLRSAQIGAGWVTWVAQTGRAEAQVEAYAIAGGRYRHWTVAAAAPGAVHTARRVFVQTADRLDAFGL